MPLELRVAGEPCNLDCQQTAIFTATSQTKCSGSAHPRHFLTNSKLSAPSGTENKIVSRSKLPQRIATLRNQGERLVFTNGCFDLLHAGHVRYLQAARALGNALVLGLNSDASVQRLKGPTRPLVPEGDRALVLSALEAVSLVVVFGEDTPDALIREVMPDVLVKGGDYKVEEIVGHDTVTQSGGRVEIIPFVEGRSTTKLVNLIRERS